QKADWGARPLKDKLLRYAFDDVRYLLPLADKLTEKVKSLGRHEWFTEWCHVSRDNVLARKERSPDEVWRIPGWGKLDRGGLVFLRELWHWRDDESQSRDCPPFRVMSNQSLLDFSTRAARGDAVRGAKGLNPSQAKRFRAAIEKAREVPRDEWPVKRLRKGGRREEFNAEGYEALRKIRDNRASELDLEPTIIATRGTLETLANYPEKREELLMNWQRQILFSDE
ncbi:MAG: HRDC domain-containing protein, partial [Verrucomicrobiota bacterium]